MNVEQLIKKQKEKQEGPLCAYIYNLKELRQHVSSMKESLPSFCRLFYAMKANPDLRILGTLAPLVDGFEVASGGELAKSKEASAVFFGAPAKKDEELRMAIEKGVEAVNVESLHDLNRIHWLSKEKNTVTPILLRVNLQGEVPESHHMMSGVPTQFGIDEREVPALINKALEMDHVKVQGFHFHAMSNNLDAVAHLTFVTICLEKTKQWRDRFNLSLEVVDIGGGIGLNYWNPEAGFDWKHFAAGLHDLEHQMDGLTLILEIGRYMIGAAGRYAAEVIDVKTTHDHHFALIRGGTHHLRLPAAWKMSHPFSICHVDMWDFPYERPGVKDKEVSIAGELCTPNDLLVKNQPIEKIRAGDIVIFQYAGAYAWTISHHEFLSHPKPAFIYIE